MKINENNIIEENKIIDKKYNIDNTNKIIFENRSNLKNKNLNYLKNKIEDSNSHQQNYKESIQNNIKNVLEIHCMNQNEFIVKAGNRSINTSENKNNKNLSLSENQFSFDCQIPKFTITKGEKIYSVSLSISNNGINAWKKDVYLIFQENEFFSCNNLSLKSLKPNESQDIEIQVNEKKDFEIGKYTLFFDFVIENIKYGTINIEIEFIR